jgi:hypothetical protein
MLCLVLLPEFRMTRIFGICALALTLSTTAASAQEGFLGLGVAVQGQFPMGDFDDVAGFGWGGLGSVELGGDGLSLTARSGYLEHFERHDNTYSFIPIMGGIKISAEDRMVYLAGEVGAVKTRVTRSGLLSGGDVNETNLGWGLAVGSEAGPLDLRFGFNVWDAGHASRLMSIGLSMGFTVWPL